MLGHDRILWLFELLRDCQLVQGDSTLGFNLGKGVSVESTVIQIAELWRRHHVLLFSYHIPVNVWVLLMYQIQLVGFWLLLELLFILET